MKWLKRMLWALVLVTVATVGAGQAGLFKGTPPSDLGVREGRLKAPSTRPNSVSSQAMLWPGHPQAQAAQIAPLALKSGEGPATLAALLKVVRTAPGAVVMKATPDYIYAEFKTPLMKYVDDVEFWLDPAAGVIHVRSASRLGDSDLGANRQRIEAIRAHLAQQPP
jgi:uncharacterized protein (DUF1499 family)